jgi:hypothetical protein
MTAHESASDSTGEARAADVPFVTQDERDADTHAAPWAELEGCETRLGGALFLLNLFAGLRLPECFDDEYGLSEHITGWGLTELLTRALLGGGCAEFDADPLWGALASLDGRREGEPPATALRVGDNYRAPARWLKLFAPRDEAWLVGEEAGRLLLRHAGGFPIAVRTLGGRARLEAAAQLADEYRAQGVAVGRLEDVPASPGESFNVSDGPHVHGGAALSLDLRRWMGWTFPFLTYALTRALAGDAEPGAQESAREMLLRRGRLYCTATHVDLVMEMNGVSLAARRAGFDASPGWVRDLVRVVAFHYE